MTYHNTVQGDRIDLIVFGHYGSIDMLPEVLAKNIFLTKLDSMVLESNLKIFLPDSIGVAPESRMVIEENELLW